MKWLQLGIISLTLLGAWARPDYKDIGRMYRVKNSYKIWFWHKKIRIVLSISQTLGKLVGKKDHNTSSANSSRFWASDFLKKHMISLKKSHDFLLKNHMVFSSDYFSFYNCLHHFLQNIVNSEIFRVPRMLSLRHLCVSFTI